MTSIKNPIPLDETDLYVLFHEYERVYLFEKGSNREVWTTEVYGNPTCGHIGLTNEWALVGGPVLILWKKNRLKTIDDHDLNWIHRIQQIGESKVRVLTDPWKQNSSIWEFDIYSENKIKIRNFPDYFTKEFTEDIDW